MALTRIKENQITDSAVTTAKIANNAVTAGKLANNITYGSDLTVSGNLTVSGTTVSVSTTNTRIDDAILALASGTSGTPSEDAGILINRGSGDNYAFLWDESADQFVLANVGSEDGDTSGNVTLSSYAPIQMGALTSTSITASGAVNIDDTTASSSKTTGALIVDGGIGVAGTVYATAFNGSLTGTADDADALSSAVTVTLTGDVTGSATFVNAGDTASITTTIAANSVALGTDTTGDYTATITGGNGIASSGATSGEGIAHSLSVDLTDTAIFASDGTASRAVVLDGSGDFSANMITSDLTGDVTGTADVATSITATANNATDESVFLTFVDGATGTQGIETDTGLTYNPSSGLLTSTGFVGALTGTADVATSITATANDSTDETVYLTFVDGQTGTQGIETDLGLTYNPSSGALTSTSFVGALTGTADDADALSSAVTVALTGDVTGSATFTSAGDTASISTTIAANSVALGTDTTGNYVATLADAGNSFFTITNGTGEGGAATIDLVAGSVTLGTHTSGNYVATITGGNGITSSGATSGETIAHSLSVDLTDTNIFASDGTVSRAVVLDGSGDFSAGTITAAIDGIVGGNTPAAGTFTTVAANTSATLASAAVSDLTSGRVVLAGTSGELEDSASLTFNGSTLAVNGAVTVGTSLDVTGTTSLDGAVNLGDASGDAISVIGTATFTPSADFDGGFTVAGSQTIDMGANAVTNVADPSSAQHAATKAYVDSSVSSASSLTISDGSATDAVVVGTNTLTFAGTANEITTAVTDNQVQIGLPNDVTVGNDLTVAGNLTVQGTTTTLSTTNSVVSDALIELNSGAGSNANDLGFIFERGSTGDNAVFAWDESADKFTLGTTTATGASTGDLTISSGTLVAALEGNADTATALQTSRTIALAGDVVGSVGFDGTGNVSITTTIQADSVALGTDTTGNYVQSIADAGSSQFTITNGTAEGGAATIALANNAVTLGTHTAGNYVATLADAGNSFFTIANSGSESAAVTIDLVAGSVTLGTHTSGDFVGTITGGAGIASTGATTGEDTDHSLSVDLTDTSVFNSDGTVSTAVVLDGSGDFSANMITSDLTGDVTGTADIATSITATANNSTDESVFLTFVDGATGTQGIETDTGLTYNPSSGLLTSTGFVGDVTGTADVATSITATANNATNETVYVTFVDGVSGTQGIETDTGLTYNPSTNVLTTTTFSGALSGNADTATSAAALTTARAIEVSGAVTGTANFDGSSAINIVTTATADPTITLAGDLSGSVTLTNLGDGTLTATIAANSVALGTDTTGNYVGTITGGNGIASSGATTGEGIAHSLSVDLTDTNVFNSDGTVSTAVVLDGSGDFSAGTITAAIDGIVGGNTPAAGTFTTLTANTSATLASAAVSDLTSGRVVLAGTSGELEDNGNLTFNGSTLAVTGSITASSNVDIADAGSLRVGTGNDFTINHDGTNTTITNGTGILAIDGLATSSIRINEAGANVDTVIEGDTNASLVVVDASGDNVGIGGAPNANTVFHVNDTGAMIITSGTTVQRPATAVTGMFRFNTSINGIEYYDNSAWATISSDFTVATSQTFNGDNSTVAFTLSALTGSDSYSVAGVLVMINGVVQEPTTVYGVSGTTLTFTTAPASGDLIEVRKFTTTTTVNALTDVDGDTQIQVEESSDEDIIRFDIAGSEKMTLNATQLSVTGNIVATGNITANGDITLGDADTDSVTFNADVASHLIPDADDTYDLGSSSKKWRDLYLSGSSLYLGNLVLKDNGSNVMGVFQSDGTTPASISGAITGNADTATALETARTIGGVSFDGTANINLAGVNTAGNQDTSGNAATATALETARTIAGNSFDGTANITIASTDLSDTADLARLAAPAFTGTATGVNLTLSGDLTVNGTTTTLATTNTTITDNLIELNNGAASNANDSGIVIERGSTGDNAFMGWDESADKFVVGTTTATGASTGDLTISAGTLVAATFEGALTGDVTGNADTATALETARNIGGVSFDGTANINLPGVNTTGNQNTSGSAATLTTARAIEVSGAVTGTANFDGSAAINIVTTATSDPTITLTGDVTGSGTMTNLGDVSFATTIAANSVALGTDTTGNYVGTGATSGNGISGSVSSEGGTFTVTSNAVSTNTANTIVFRDGSGNFSAGVITGTSTAARYADLAEMYAADAEIEPGTVVHFAGEGKVAACDVENCRAVAGIVSTDPAHLMNSEQEGVALALAGRVPCKVTGPVAAGDLMVSAGNGMAMANNEAAMGTVIGKAIEANEGGEGVIEVLALMM